MPPGVRLRAVVRLMLASIVVMLVAIFTLCFAPLPAAPAIAAALYAGLWIRERQVGVCSPLTWVMTTFYVGFALTGWWFGHPYWTAWFPLLVYFTLAALILSLLLAGRPFTAFYTGDAGFPPLLRRIAAIWGGLHLLAGLAALLFVPHPAFIYVPVSLMVAGAVATLWINFVSMGAAHERQPHFALGDFSFREVRAPEDRALFYEVISEAYRTDLQKTLGARRKLGEEEIRREHRASDARRENTFLPFLAFSGRRPVGGICIFFDHRDHGLPLEGEAPLDLAPWRRAGPVAEVGRLGVLPSYRINPTLLKGLFKCVIEAAAERRVCFLFNDSFSFQVRIYEKIGFSPLQERPYRAPETGSTGYGLEILPMMLDLAGMVRMDVEKSVTSDMMRDVLAPYVLERYFKHLTLRETVDALFRPGRRRPEMRDARA